LMVGCGHLGGAVREPHPKAEVHGAARCPARAGRIPDRLLASDCAPSPCQPEGGAEHDGARIVLPLAVFVCEAQHVVGEAPEGVHEDGARRPHDKHVELAQRARPQRLIENPGGRGDMRPPAREIPLMHRRNHPANRGRDAVPEDGDAHGDAEAGGVREALEPEGRVPPDHEGGGKGGDDGTGGDVLERVHPQLGVGGGGSGKSTVT